MALAQHPEAEVRFLSVGVSVASVGKRGSVALDG